MLVAPLKEREKRSTWKDGGKDTPVIQLKTAFIEIDGQPMTKSAKAIRYICIDSKTKCPTYFGVTEQVNLSQNVTKIVKDKEQLYSTNY